MKRRTVSMFLAAILLTGTILSGCGGEAPADTSSADTQGSATDAAADTAKKEEAAEPAADRPGGAWIDSGILGTFEGREEIRLQDDFAAAVNREWAENAKIAEGESEASSRTEQTERLNEEKLKVLTGEARTDDKDLTTLQNFYALLVDWDARNAAGADELKPYAEDIMSIKNTDEMIKYFSDPDRCLYGPAMLMDVVKPDGEDASKNVLAIISPAMLGSESTDYEEGQEGDAFKVKEQIADYMLTRIGYSEDEAKKLFAQAVAFEKQFVPGIDAMEARMAEEGPAAMNATFPAEELKETYKNLPVVDIYKAWGYDIKGEVGVMMPDVLAVYDKCFTDENIEGIKVWTLVNTVSACITYCDREAFENNAKFNQPLTGTADVKKDEVYALETMTELMPSMLDEMYVNYCFDKEIKPQLAELVDMMIEAYREMLQEEDWLSDENREAAIDKLDHIKKHVCYPEKLPDRGTVTIKSKEEGGTAFEAIKAAKRFSRQAAASMLSRKNDGTYWSDEVQYSTLGACYMQMENSINIFAGMCGGDYYDPDWPLERKLGGICMVVGHEITHAFDNKGALYDKDGNLKNWWTEEDMKAFEERVDKLDAYYSALVPAPQISDEPYGDEGAEHVNGEAIADLGSLKCLLSIAKKQENFDYDLFFRQLATIQKSVRYEEAEKYYIMTNEHPVECYRANIPIQNYDEFLETYDVKEGDGMYLAPEDRIRVW